MSKKKKNKKRNPQRTAPNANSQKSSGTPKLSLCMIVKDEEKNIEKALGWAKDVTFEQIVVDTGSKDRTVELAEKMGAKVFHFEWIDDFSAAKNYAIEQASGNWIVFFDADEYFLDPDAKRLAERISQIEKQKSTYPHCLAVGCTLINLDDKGAQNSQLIKVCAFRNRPDIRYKGRIHEMLDISDKALVHLPDTIAYHTGYTESASLEKQKSERNVRLLRKELELNPHDMNIKAYIADALTSRTDEESQNEAAALYEEVLESGKKTFNKLRVKAYLYFIRKYMTDKNTHEKAVETCKIALKEFPETVDFYYYLGHVISDLGDYKAAWEVLKTCETKLNNPSPHDESIFLPASPIRLYGRLMMLANALSDFESVFMYSTIILTIDNKKHEVLTACIKTLVKQGITEQEIIPLLKDLYDLNNPTDVEFIKNTAKTAGATKLVEILAS